jgi:predicted RNA polymerase sigma factor
MVVTGGFSGLRERDGWSERDAREAEARRSDVWPRSGSASEPGGLLYAVNLEYATADRARRTATRSR